MKMYTLDLIAPIDEVARQIELAEIREAQDKADKENEYQLNRGK